MSELLRTCRVRMRARGAGCGDYQGPVIKDPDPPAPSPYTRPYSAIVPRITQCNLCCNSEGHSDTLSTCFLRLRYEPNLEIEIPFGAADGFRSILPFQVQVPHDVPSRYRWRSGGFAVSCYSSTPHSIFDSSTQSIRFAAFRRSRSCTATCGLRFGSISDRSQAAASADAARVVDNGACGHRARPRLVCRAFSLAGRDGTLWHFLPCVYRRHASGLCSAHGRTCRACRGRRDSRALPRARGTSFPQLARSALCSRTDHAPSGDAVASRARARLVLCSLRGWVLRVSGDRGDDRGGVRPTQAPGQRRSQR